MGCWQVNVDEEVFAYVKEHAEPLVDDFNSTIKRLLGLPSAKRDRARQRSPGSASSIPGLSLRREVPQALRQILEVAHLVSKQGVSRTDATRDVANSHRVTPQTVLDKYCRQLGLTASVFDQLLEDPDLAALRDLLRKKFHEHSQVIENVLSGE